MGDVLTVDQVRDALSLDFDYPTAELTELAQTASSFLIRKTGYDFSQDSPIEPLAIQAAKLYVRQQFFGADGYNKEHDYSLGLTSLLIDLQSIAQEKTTA
jgi:hypothetical protein